MFGGRHPWATVLRDFEPRSPLQKDLAPDPARREISDGPDQAFAMASHPTLGVEEEFLLADPTTGEPVAVNKENINETVVKDEFWKASEICTGPYKAACKEAGIE